MLNKHNFLYSEGGGFKPVFVENPDFIEFIIIDLFCGAGGTSTGFINAMINQKRIAIVAACVNHDWKAIKSHWENHPDVVHFNEDIKTLELGPLQALVEAYRVLYPNAKIILWASLECTNFSKAKGGQPRDADSRTLAEHLDRYIIALNPDYVQIENVVEFMSWGPLDENGKPISRRSGSDWLKWRNHINSFGYRDDWTELNSANFGAYTSRNRLFGCFAKTGLPIIFPSATHAKKPVKAGFYGEGLQKWKAVKDVLDFDDEGESIFSRKKRLSDKTLERIYAGLIKYVAGGKDKFIQQLYATASNSAGNYDTDRPARTVTTRDATAIVTAAFLSRYNSGNPDFRNTSIEEPSRTLLTANTQALIQTCFIQKHFSGKPEGKVISVEGPAGTVTTSANQSLIQPKFIVQRNSGNPDGRVVDIDGPARTLTGIAGNQDLVKCCFLSHYYGSGGQHSSIQVPAPVIPTKARTAIIRPVWLDKTYGGKDNHQSVEQPAGVVMTNDKHQLVQTQYMIQYNGGKPEANTFGVDRPMRTLTAGHGAKHNIVNVQPFIMTTNQGVSNKDTNEPCPTLLASRRHHYIVNPSHAGNCTSVEAPCPVIIARQDKSPLYLTETIPGLMNGDFDIFFTEVDIALMNEMYEYGPQHQKSIRVKIIEFMLMYGIADIKMRMLKVLELLSIQGFPKHYKLYGNQSDQKKFIGNSVVPHVVTAWCEALGVKLRELRRAAA